MKLKDHQPPNVQAPRPAPTGFPNKSFLALLYSSKGTGKTNTLVNILQEYDKHKFFQKVYLFSPTAKSDPKYQLLENGKHQLKVYNNYTNDDFKEVVEEITADLKAWKEYERLKKLYEKAKRAKKPELFNDDELLDLYMIDWQAPEPPFEKEPYSLIIFDDLASNPELMKSGKSVANAFMLLHRHRLCSCIYSVQIFKNAVPRMVRNNLDFIILGANKSKEVMAEVAEEFSSYASKDEFINMWESATAEPFNYFCINLMIPEYRFTKNFDEKIDLKIKNNNKQ